MSNIPQDDRETRKVMDDFARMLRQRSEEEREALLIQARDEALAEELAEEREQSERDAAALRESLIYDPGKERDRARETAKSAALLLIMLLLILLLIAAATGRTDILPIAGVQSTQTLRPYLSTATGEFETNVFGPDAPPGTTPTVDAFFIDKYNEINRLGSECSLGDPITLAYTERGLRYQWFQRGLLREMPSYIDDPRWHIQGYLLGREVTTAIPLPTSSPFLSQPGEYLFRETGYRVSGQFLDFWAKCDGEWLLGYPVSDPVYEVLTPGQQPYQVQYFERGRLEYHHDDPNRPVQFGLLGLIKRKDANFTPSFVTPQVGTPVVLPIATATALPAPTSAQLPAATALPLPTSMATAVPAAPPATVYPAP